MNIHVPYKNEINGIVTWREFPGKYPMLDKNKIKFSFAIQFDEPIKNEDEKIEQFLKVLRKNTFLPKIEYVYFTKGNAFDSNTEKRKFEGTDLVEVSL